jgi:hypothetical protein
MELVLVGLSGYIARVVEKNALRPFGAVTDKESFMKAVLNCKASPKYVFVCG